MEILKGIHAPREQEKLLEKYSRKKGIWFGNEHTFENWRFIGSGCEARVYEYTDITKILKVICYNVSCDSPQQFFRERIELYNLLFPETGYELIGFAKYYGDFCFVVIQPFIEGGRLEMKEIENEMQKRSFTISQYKFINQNFTLEDLHQGNVLKDKHGNMFVIDAIPGFIIPENNKNTPVIFNNYYLQRQKDMQKALLEMRENPLSFEKKKKQTQFILDSLYL